MGIIAWIIFGLIAGAVAKLLMPGKDPGGIIVTIVIGILGAVLGGFISTALGMGTVSGFNLGSFSCNSLGGIFHYCGFVNQSVLFI